MQYGEIRPVGTGCFMTNSNIHQVEDGHYECRMCATPALAGWSLRCNNYCYKHLPEGMNWSELQDLAALLSSEPIKSWADLDCDYPEGPEHTLGQALGLRGVS